MKDKRPVIITLCIFMLMASGVFFLAGAFASSGLASPAGSSALYDEYVNNYGQKHLSFGHDVDVMGKIEDLARTIVSNLDVGKDWKSIKENLVNTYDLWKQSRNGEVNADDLSIFVSKTILANLSDNNLLKVQKKLHLSDAQMKALKDHAANMAEAGGQAAGSAAGGAGWRETVKTVALGVMDSACPECAAARRAVLVAIEVAKAGQAWVEDEMTQMAFKNWADWNGDPALFLTLPGYTQVINAAKDAYRRAYGHYPSSDAELEKFIEKQFRRWKKAQDNAAREAEILKEVKSFYLKMDPFHRSLLGGTEEERIRNFCNNFIRIYNDLLRYKGKHHMPLGGRRLLYMAVVYLLKHRDDPVAIYRKKFFGQLKMLGWWKPRQRYTKKLRAARLAHIRKRMAQLGHERLLKLLKYMGVWIKSDEQNKFMNCLCKEAGYGASGTTQIYHPDTYGEYNPHYYCNHPDPGNPCIVAGFGCSRHPLPGPDKTDKDGKRSGPWASCLKAYKVEYKGRKLSLDALIEEHLRLDTF